MRTRTTMKSQPFVLLFMCCIHGSLAVVETFRLNKKFLSQPFPPPAYISEELLSVVDDFQSARFVSSYGARDAADGTTWRAVRSQACSALRPTLSCCDQWYIPSTIQHDECVSSTPNEVRRIMDPFNYEKIDHIRSCLHRDMTTLAACCRWITKGIADLTRKCIATRVNIMRSGLRVCILGEKVKRRRCCKAMFRGRLLLYRRCISDIPVYVNREAPCVHRDKAAQEKCCAQLFPLLTDGRVNRAYELCASAVERTAIGLSICFSQSTELKAACCAKETLYGKYRFNSCMNQAVPPCRMADFGTRLQCCFLYFPHSSKKRTQCMIKEFKTCQLKSWRDRIACCASIYRAGSDDMKHCLYQFLHTAEQKDEQVRFNACKLQYPAGSRLFDYCMIYMLRLCHLKSATKRDLKDCCNEHFQAEQSSRALCESHYEGSEYLKLLYESKPHLRRLSDSTRPSQPRVQYCKSVFPGDIWLRYACLTEITVSGSTFYHFTLYADTTMPGDAQFTCAILDEDERESCCSLNFPSAGTSFTECMSWTPSTGLESASMLSSEEEMKLEQELALACNSEQKPVSVLSARETTSSERLTRFLELMKIVEDIIHYPNVETTSSIVDDEDNEHDENTDAEYDNSGGGDETDNGNLSEDDTTGDDDDERYSAVILMSTTADIPLDLLKVYKAFRNIVQTMTSSELAALFFHTATKTWMSCLSVRASTSPSDLGLLYCARLDNIEGREVVPKRRPVFGWECGALNAVASKSSGPTRMQVSRQVPSRAIFIDLGKQAPRQLSSRATLVDLGQMSTRSPPKPSPPPLQDARQEQVSDGGGYGNDGMRVVNLLQDTGDCNVANMNVVCFALCCDSYFSNGPACSSLYLDCVG